MAVLDVIVGYVRGLKGDTGETGATGATGPGATVSVGTVTTTTYGNPAQVTNSGTATDAVLNFVIPQGAPGEEVTDVSSLTLDSVTSTAASFPIPAVGEVMSVIMGKIIKFFGDTVTALNAKLNRSDVTTSLGVTTTGQALDATAGKTLNDSISALNDSFILYRAYTITYSPQTGVSLNNGCTLRRRGYTGVFIVNLSFNNFTNPDYVQVASAASVKLANDYVTLVPVTEGGYVFVKVSGNGSVQVAKYSTSSQCSGQVLVSIPVIFDITTDD